MQPNEYRPIAFKAHGRVCNSCGDTSDLHVHHQDGDRENNEPENLEVLCKDCHWDEHRPEWVARNRGPTGEPGEMITDEMTATDALTELMREGRVTPAYAAEVTGYKRSYMGTTLNEMAEGEEVRKFSGGLYELIEDPHGEQMGVDLDAVRRCVEKLDTALERGDKGTVRECMTKLKEALDDA